MNDIDGHYRGRWGQRDEALVRLERHRAVRVIAARTGDAAICRKLFDMLGLDPREGKTAQQAPATTAPRHH